MKDRVPLCGSHSSCTAVRDCRSHIALFPPQCFFLSLLGNPPLPAPFGFFLRISRSFWPPKLLLPGSITSPLEYDIETTWSVRVAPSSGGTFPFSEPFFFSSRLITLSASLAWNVTWLYAFAGMRPSLGRSPSLLLVGPFPTSPMPYLPLLTAVFLRYKSVMDRGFFSSHLKAPFRFSPSAAYALARIWSITSCPLFQNSLAQVKSRCFFFHTL